MKDQYDLDRAEPEKLRALLAWHLDGGASSNIHPLVKELRDQCRVPLRTKAEVDAEMVALMRDRCGRGGTLEEDKCLWLRFNELAREPTAPAERVLPITCSKCQAQVTAGEAEAHWATCGVPEAEEPLPPGERPCGCEDSQALQAHLTALRARNFDLAMQLSRIRKLARAPEVQALFEEVDREP